MHYVMVNLLIKDFCCSKKNAKGIVGIMKSPHQNFCVLFKYNKYRNIDIKIEE
jgi:hypothetical protein